MEHSHDVENDFKTQWSKPRQSCKRTDFEDPTKRSQKLVIEETGKINNDTYVLEDISTELQVMSRVRRKTLKFFLLKSFKFK